ncbi:hypothetical protein E2C01_009273 [Portunus trituberculatus]|uniref:Uncharacterized protein n=1 Tax=Portunus trituberculatus TaxID=210409 RepID=A0A5B7D437_PORTR|nr:hypothetical protein [Portunus trituberculatus]
MISPFPTPMPLLAMILVLVFHSAVMRQSTPHIVRPASNDSVSITSDALQNVNQVNPTPYCSALTTAVTPPWLSANNNYKTLKDYNNGANTKDNVEEKDYNNTKDNVEEVRCSRRELAETREDLIYGNSSTSEDQEIYNE